MMSPRRRARVFLVLGSVILAIVIGFGARYFFLRDSTSHASLLGATIGGPFTLVDQDGKTRTNADFRNEYMLVYFGYTYCPDLCPTELQTMSDALDRLGPKAAKVQPIFITVDPDRDTVPVMKAYVGHFHPRLIGLTGTHEQVAEAIKAYRAYAAKVPAKDGGNDYLMDHSGFVYLMDPDGHYLSLFTPQTSAEQMAKTIAKYL